MKKGATELVFVLDRSGSMSHLVDDTIGGYNSFLERQREEPGDCVLTTALFDDRFELLHDRINLRGIAPLTRRDYSVRGSTALLDALGQSIHKMINVQRATAEPERAEKVVFVVITDGMENASHEYTLRQIRALIERQKAEFGWEFIFMGANIDAVSVAEGIGIDACRSVTYRADAEGTSLNYRVLDEAITDIRAGRPLAKSWKERIEQDVKKRGQ